MDGSHRFHDRLVLMLLVALGGFIVTTANRLRNEDSEGQEMSVKFQNQDEVIFSDDELDE